MKHRLVLFGLKLVLALCLFYWLYHKQLLDFSPLLALQGTPATFVWIGMGLLFFGLGLILMAWRLWLLLRMQRFAVSFGDVLNITCFSSLAGTLLPGMVGADVLKVVFFCGRVAERRMDAFVAVIFDRMVGLYGLLVLGSIASILVWSSGMEAIPLYLSGLAPGVVVGLTAGAALVKWPRFFDSRPVQAVYRRLPERLRRMLDSFRNLVQFTPDMFAVLGLAMLNHLFSVCAFLTAAYLLGDVLPWLLHFPLTPLAMTMNAVPLTPGGLGVTESAFAVLFQLGGSEQGALVGLMGRLLQYLMFITTGGVALFFLKWRGYPINALTHTEEQQAYSKR